MIFLSSFHFFTMSCEYSIKTTAWVKCMTFHCFTRHWLVCHCTPVLLNLRTMWKSRFLQVSRRSVLLCNSSCVCVHLLLNELSLDSLSRLQTVTFHLLAWGLSRCSGCLRQSYHHVSIGHVFFILFQIVVTGLSVWHWDIDLDTGGCSWCLLLFSMRVFFERGRFRCSCCWVTEGWIV